VSLTAQRWSVWLISPVPGILISVSFAGLWEVVAKTPFVMNSFAKITRVHGYVGNSVVNSMGDKLVTARLLVPVRPYGSGTGRIQCDARPAIADPTSRQARELGANALEQLGYQAEAATWRNAYLMGAMELRNGVTKIPVGASSLDMIRAIPTDAVIDLWVFRLNPRRPKVKRS
jgi:hypothetical protein